MTLSRVSLPLIRSVGPSGVFFGTRKLKIYFNPLKVVGPRTIIVVGMFDFPTLNSGRIVVGFLPAAVVISSRTLFSDFVPRQLNGSIEGE